MAKKKEDEIGEPVGEPVEAPAIEPPKPPPSVTIPKTTAARLAVLGYRAASGNFTSGEQAEFYQLAQSLRQLL